MTTATQTDALITVSNITKSYAGQTVLNNINLSVAPREIVAIIGASGCGKSTLLKIIAGLESPDTGEVQLASSNYTMLFQYSALFDSLNVFENVAFALREAPDYNAPNAKAFKRMREADIEKTVIEKLELVGLSVKGPDSVVNKFPSQLSGGMQKRVSFARGIVANPDIILYDEPTAGLDPIASTVIEDDILKLRDQLNAAGVVVTHQWSTIVRTADRVCLLSKGQLVWEGPPSGLKHADNEEARAFAQASSVSDAA